MENKSIIYQCEKLIRDIINEFALRQKGKPFLEAVIKYLKFSEPKDWTTLCSLLDILGDTELAKENFEKFGISGPTKIEDIGEKHLRLYGILNSVYLQKSAIIEFLHLVKHKDKSVFEKNIEGLKLLELRHIVGAHTVNYLDKGVKNPHQLQRSSLDQKSIRTLDSKGNFKEYNLNELVRDYNQKSSEILFSATEKFVMTVFKNGGQKKEKYLKKLKYIKNALEGDLVIHTDADFDPIIIKWKK